MLTINELVKPALAQSTRNHETYKAMYEHVAGHIKRVNDIGGRETTWTVPAFVFGRPPFTHGHALNYVSEKLRRGGFTITLDSIDEGKLHIDWKSAHQRAARAKMRAATQASQASQKKKSTPVKKVEKAVPISVTLERLRKNLHLKPK